jgi:hypothetical protein
VKFDNYAQFYPYYLTQHTNPVCRTLHFIGTSLALCVLVGSIATQQWWGLLLGVVIGYAFAWVGHFGFEKNKPASFGHPFWSFASDWVMWSQMLTGKVPFSGTLNAPATTNPA